MNSNGKYKYFLTSVCVNAFLIMVFAGSIALAETLPISKNIPVIGQAQKKKLDSVVNKSERSRQPSKEKNYRYNVKVSPDAETIRQSPGITKTRQHGERITEPNSRIKYNINITQALNARGESSETLKSREHGKIIQDPRSRIEYDIKIVPAEKAPGQFPEKIKTRRHGEPITPEDGGIRTQLTIKPLRKDKEPKYEISITPGIAEKSQSVQMNQAAINNMIKVTRVQTWKLDASGNRTKEVITDSNKTIEGVFQPPSE